MVDAQLAATLTQFGVAGLIGCLWLLERRAAGERERQLGDMHERLIDERKQIDVLLAALAANTRALTALEVGQRGLAVVLSRLARSALTRRDDPR